MKLTWTLCALAALFLVACSEPTREEVISRFPGGEKQVVAVYQGTGTNEELVERHTFNEQGEIILLEDLVDGTTLGWQELHPELDTSKGLRTALQGDWYNVYTSEYVDVSTRQSFSGPSLESEITSVYRFGDEDMPIESFSTGSVEYLPDRQVRVVLDLPESPDMRLPAITTTTTIEFTDSEAYDTSVTTRIDDRIEVGPLFGGTMYRDRGRAEANSLHPDEFEVLGEAVRSAWSNAIAGDERLKAEYPDWYAVWVEQPE